MNEIRKELDYYMSVIDIVISEDRFSHQASGVTSYCNR